MEQSFALTEELGLDAFSVRPGLTIEAKRDVKIPAFVAALNSGGSAFLVQVMVRGASVFFCNDDMASQFINAAEAEEEHATTKDDPGSVMKRLVAQRDRPAYLRAAARLLVHLPQLASETSFMAHIVTRDGNRVLCLVQLRASFSADGENVVMGTKLIPVPEPRPGEGMPAGFAGMPQFMMPFPMLANQQGGAGGGGGGNGLPMPFNPSLPWAWPLPGGPGAMGPGADGKVGSAAGKNGESAEEVSKEAEESRKRYEANWETRRKTKKSKKDDGEDDKGEEGGDKDDESYEEQQKNVRRRQQQIEKQQMEQIQLQYFQQMQMQHQQQLMASMGQMPFGMMGFNGNQAAQPAASSEVPPPNESASGKPTVTIDV
jgi:hypothetical protein